MIAPQGYWHLRGRARQIAKAKWCKFYEDDRHLNPLLVFSDFCNKYHLPQPEVEVTFIGDKLLLQRGDKQHVLALDTPANVARIVFNYLSKPAQAAESTNLRTEN